VCGQDNPHGLRLRSRVEDGVVVLDYTTRERDLGYRHIVHGGIAMTLLDEVMTWAAMLAARKVCVAAEMSTRLRKPLAVNRPIRVEGRVSGGRPRLLVTTGLLLDENGETLVSASGKYVPMSMDNAASCSEDFVISPESIDLDELFGD